MEKPHRNIVTRFAPSPTGFMHVGGIRTALYSWLYARKHGGTFILRIEDTDKEREVEGSIAHIIESLKWLGIDWDEGPDNGGVHAPYTQSHRLDIYKKYALELIEKGYAYPDPYTQEEVENFRKNAEEKKEAFLFRNHRPEKFGVWDGTQPLRFKVPVIKRYEWHDLVFGDLSAGEEALDDFILIKSDGYPTYNFAHIIDDIEMGVTHVMRGQEFISSTPKFLSVYDALGKIPPLFATLPHIMANGGQKKLGKRDGSKDALEYRNEGYLPEAMVNFLTFLGWNPGDDREIMTKEELIRDFDIQKVQKSGAQFNDDKLDWINREYLKKLSYEEQEEYIQKFIPQNIKDISNYNQTIIHNIVPIIMERISKGNDIKDMAISGDLNYFFEKPIYDKESLFFKNSKITQENKYKILASYLEKVIALIEQIKDFEFTKEKVKETLWPFAEEIGRGDILWPMRFALSGREKSPDPFTLAEVLGKEETIQRIGSAIKILEK